ncbi:MAG: TonB-dependent receptor [Brevundimonas sp.]|uniref:TonB-dependent receptor n=1 Tax=Brevundimonas sp. TaxID=1871086 RepID=UPI002489C634|nr:TonB-dependent receptor [Brevundimonas sp.]MDI1327248.1 TonB-dependent receptor [Brevundimonas sp.]
MRMTPGACALLLGAPLMAAVPAHAQDAALLDEIIVTGVRTDTAIHAIRPEGLAAAAPDSAGLVARLPGAALIDNGGLSGQVQYRGLFGERVLTRVNSQRFHSGGPNAMDPPLHYAPMPLVASVEVDRGISPVRNGPALAGGVNARLKEVGFGEGAAFAPAYDLTAGYRSVDDSRSFGGVAGMASERFRVNLLGARETGGDMRFPGGVVRDSGFRRDTWGLSAGWRGAHDELGLDLRAQETGPTGTPPFALDILYFDTDFARLSFASPAESTVRLEASLGHVRVEHGMDNFSLRPAPAMASMRRLSLADAETVVGEARLVFGSPTRSLSVGADFEQADKSVVITHPDNPDFVVGSLPGIEVSRLGGHLEWRGAVRGVEAELGVRADAHRASAGEAWTGSAVPAGPTLLAAAFNAGDRDWGGGTADLAARFWRDLGDFTPRLTLARKTRAPNAVERFSWMPTEASGGLADGNIYVGDRTLRPETAWIVEGGFDWLRGAAWARPTIYYRRVDDYIQGVPFDATPGVADTRLEMVAAMSGDPTPLRFANVDAALYGFDMDFGLQVTDRLRLDGVASLVRGKRRDVSDDLYRIAPPTLRLAATWDETDWSVGAEVAGTLRQTHVSAGNDETPSGGHALVNLRGEWRPRSGLQLEAGVENLFDRDYRAHLAGRNRVADSDVALGERLPGAGRGAFVTLKAALR